MKFPDLNIRSYRGHDGLAECKKFWRELFAESNSDNPFLTWEWNHAWASAFAPDDAICVHVAEVGGKPIAIAPLLSSGRKTSFLMDPLFADYADFLVATDAPQDVLRAFLERCVETEEKAVFGPIRGRSLTGQHLLEIARDLGRPSLLEAIGPNLCVTPSSDFDFYMKGRNKKLLQEMRTTLNHLNRGGTWEFIECNDTVVADHILDSMILFHCGRQEGKVGLSIFHSRQNQEFFRSLFHIMAEGPAHVHLSGIVWQGRFISAAYSLVCGNTLFYWIPSFDQTIKGVSLGKLHIKCLLEKCFATGMTFDFMGGNEAYKYQWSNDVYENKQVHIFPSHLQKATTVGIAKVRGLAKMAMCRSAFLSQIWKNLSKLSNVSR